MYMYRHSGPSLYTNSIHMRGGGGGDAYREGVGGEGEYNFNMYVHACCTDTGHTHKIIVVLQVETLTL